MKKIFFYHLFTLCIWLIFLPRGNGQIRTEKEKAALCMKEKQNLEKLDLKLKDIESKIDILKYNLSFKVLKQQSNKYDTMSIDKFEEMYTATTNLFLARIDSLKKYIPTGNKLADFENKVDLEVCRSVLDFLTAVKTQKMLGEKYDTKDNPLHKEYINLSAQLDEFEEEQKYIRNDWLMNKERIKQLRCDETTVVAGVTKYGPFSITAQGWISTGIQLKKGDSFSAEATGELTSKQNPSLHFGPGGTEVWNWWVLKAKIGTQIISIGTRGSGYANEDGILEFGAPTVNGFQEENMKDLDGAFIVTVTVTHR